MQEVMWMDVYLNDEEEMLLREIKQMMQRDYVELDFGAA
jgi:hypothetical protein